MKFQKVTETNLKKYALLNYINKFRNGFYCDKY